MMFGDDRRTLCSMLTASQRLLLIATGSGVDVHGSLRAAGVKSWALQ